SGSDRRGEHDLRSTVESRLFRRKDGEGSDDHDDPGDQQDAQETAVGAVGRMATIETTRATPSRRSRRGLKRGEAIAGYLFLLPNIVGFLVFSTLPVLATLLISALHWDMIRAPTFVALQNYQQLLFDDPTFWQVLGNTVYYVVGTVPADIVLSLLLALALNAQIRGISIFRAIFFIPVISSAVAVAVMW